MWVKNLWKFLRAISGDDAYEVYLNNFSKCTNHLNNLSHYYKPPSPFPTKRKQEY